MKELSELYYQPSHFLIHLLSLRLTATPDSNLFLLLFTCHTEYIFIQMIQALIFVKTSNILCHGTIIGTRITCKKIS